MAAAVSAEGAEFVRSLRPQALKAISTNNPRTAPTAAGMVFSKCTDRSWQNLRTANALHAMPVPSLRDLRQAERVDC